MKGTFWRRLVNLEIPAPLAAILLLFVLCIAVVLVGIDWSARGLPQKGDPGRFDTGTAKHYKQWRMGVEADRARFFNEHPEMRGLSPFEIQRRMRERGGR